MKKKNLKKNIFKKSHEPYCEGKRQFSIELEIVHLSPRPPPPPSRLYTRNVIFTRRAI